MATRLVEQSRKGFAGNQRRQTEAETSEEVRVLSFLYSEVAHQWPIQFCRRHFRLNSFSGYAGHHFFLAFSR